MKTQVVARRKRPRENRPYGRGNHFRFEIRLSSPPCATVPKIVKVILEIFEGTRIVAKHLDFTYNYWSPLSGENIFTSVLRRECFSAPVPDTVKRRTKDQLNGSSTDPHAAVKLLQNVDWLHNVQPQMERDFPFQFQNCEPVVKIPQLWCNWSRHRMSNDEVQDEALDVPSAVVTVETDTGSKVTVVLCGEGTLREFL